MISEKRNMRGQIKQFDQQEHDLYDKLGKQAILKYLNAVLPSSLRSIENPNRFGIDLLSLNEDDQVRFCWEIEVRHGNWQNDTEFPFREINCIERKDYQWRKDYEFLKKIPYKLTNNCVVYYVQLNKLCTRAVFIKDSVILEHDLIPWYNRKSDNEYVRQVPISRTKQVNLGSVA